MPSSILPLAFAQNATKYGGEHWALAATQREGQGEVLMQETKSGWKYVMLVGSDIQTGLELGVGGFFGGLLLRFLQIFTHI